MVKRLRFLAASVLMGSATGLAIQWARSGKGRRPDAPINLPAQPEQRDTESEQDGAFTDSRRGVELRRRGPAPRLRLSAVLAVAVVIGFAAWLAVRHYDKGGVAAAKSTIAAVSAQGLKTLTGTLRSPIYWAGPRPGSTYELTQTPNGRFFVRYLPVGVPIGTSKRYPFVATFPVANAFTVTQSVANEPGSIKIPTGTGAVAFYSRSLATNVYLAFRGSNYQIEIFDPNPRQARQLVALGRIESVGPTS